MYNLPAAYGSEDCLRPVDAHQVDACKEEITAKGPYPCDETVFQLACVIMAEHNKQMPHDLESAINLYIFLRRIIRNTL